MLFKIITKTQTQWSSPCPTALCITELIKSLDLALQLFGIANVQVSQKRRFDLKYKLATSAKDLAGKSMPFTDQMFGDNIKEDHANAIKNYQLTHSFVKSSKYSKRNSAHRHHHQSSRSGHSSGYSRKYDSRNNNRSSGYSHSNFSKPGHHNSGRQQKQINKFPFGSKKPKSSEQRWLSKILKNEFLPLPLPDLPVGGRLKFFVSFWKNLTHDPIILNMVTGMPLDLNSDVPPQFSAPQLIFTEHEMQAADREISQLLSKPAIVPLSSFSIRSRLFHEQCVFSSIKGLV